MTVLQRDISRTLAVKFLLLILLWFVCYHGEKKHTVDGTMWLLGTNFTPSVEVTPYDSKQ